MDVNKLILAVDNENNENILNLTTRKIKTIKNDILQKLQLNKQQLKLYHKKLKEYMYVDETHEIKLGRYIRWISLKNPSKIKLTNGAIVCDIQVGKDSMIIVCKNNMNFFIKININENLIFQKLTEQEKILLHAMDYLNK